MAIDWKKYDEQAGEEISKTFYPLLERMEKMTGFALGIQDKEHPEERRVSIYTTTEEDRDALLHHPDIPTTFTLTLDGQTVELPVVIEAIGEITLQAEDTYVTTRQ